MQFSELLHVLQTAPNSHIVWELPDGQPIPSHYHVTEVASMDKQFIDCGGTVRHERFTALQLWVADDLDHRLETNKLEAILTKAQSLFAIADVPVLVEYNMPWLTQLPIASFEQQANTLRIRLAGRQTDCLAKEVCCPGSVCENPTTASGPKLVRIGLPT